MSPRFPPRDGVPARRFALRGARQLRYVTSARRPMRPPAPWPRAAGGRRHPDRSRLMRAPVFRPGPAQSSSTSADGLRESPDGAGLRLRRRHRSRRLPPRADARAAPAPEGAPRPHREPLDRTGGRTGCCRSHRSAPRAPPAGGRRSARPNAPTFRRLPTTPGERMPPAVGEARPGRWEPGAAPGSSGPAIRRAGGAWPASWTPLPASRSIRASAT